MPPRRRRPSPRPTRTLLHRAPRTVTSPRKEGGTGGRGAAFCARECAHAGPPVPMHAARVGGGAAAAAAAAPHPPSSSCSQGRGGASPSPWCSTHIQAQAWRASHVTRPPPTPPRGRRPRCPPPHAPCWPRWRCWRGREGGGVGVRVCVGGGQRCGHAGASSARAPAPAHPPTHPPTTQPHSLVGVVGVGVACLHLHRRRLEVEV